MENLLKDYLSDKEKKDLIALGKVLFTANKKGLFYNIVISKYEKKLIELGLLGSKVFKGLYVSVAEMIEKDLKLKEEFKAHDNTKLRHSLSIYTNKKSVQPNKNFQSSNLSIEESKRDENNENNPFGLN